MQLVQSVEPAPEKVPTGHATHLDESFLKPALHTSGLQELWPTAVYAPSTAGHLVHADDPAESAKVPEAQAAQAVAPVASANLPAAHAAHWLPASASWNVPAAQAVHAPLPATANLPTAQTLQPEAPPAAEASTENWPAAQLLHRVPPVVW